MKTEKAHLAQEAQNAMKRILAQADAVSNQMGMSRGTLLLMLAVGALTAEEKDSIEMKSAIDFIAAGLATHLSDIEF